MKFTVTWIPSAESRLTELWLGSRVSARITAATDRLDALLAERPLEIGESRPAGLRIAFEVPLAIIYWVDSPARKVVVLDVWLF